MSSPGPRMARRRSTTAASTWTRPFAALALRRPQRRALGQRRADGFIGGGRDGDAVHVLRYFVGFHSRAFRCASAI